MIYTGTPQWRALFTRTTRLGAIAVAIAVAIACVLGYLYVRPPGQQDVVFTTTDAALVKPGHEVRAAGVPIGSVKSVELGRDDVKVTARIDDEVFLGDQTSVAVRMLTVAGGFYVSINSAGRQPLGDKPVPASRVSLPYTIGDLLQDAPPKIQGIDDEQLGDSLKQITTGLQDTPDSVLNLSRGLNSMIDQLTEQRQLVGNIVNVSTQYVGDFNANRAVLFTMLRKVALVIVTLDQTAVGFGQAYKGLAEMFGRIQPFLTLYWKYREEVGAMMTKVQEALKTANVTIPGMIAQLQTTMDGLQKTLNRTGRPAGAGQVLATDVCFPSEGVKC